ncbi:MAG TPA: hypothetical protein EYG21_07210, partial [Nitrospinaceae bacterium]|nr:hypothetical protein [Nitrospinaceae bacterium]
MSQSVRTGQLDLNGLKEYFSTKLSGSSTNTTGYYPYTGNPAEFSTYTQLTGISGDVSGYIDTVSGAIGSRIGTSGVALSGFTISVNATLTSNFSLLSGDFVDLSGQYVSTKTLSTGNKTNIDTLSGNLITTGQ